MNASEPEIEAAAFAMHCVEEGTQTREHYETLARAALDAARTASTREDRLLAASIFDRLGTLEEWDMLSLDDDGHGRATADAPWARSLIRGMRRELSDFLASQLNLGDNEARARELLEEVTKQLGDVLTEFGVDAPEHNVHPDDSWSVAYWRSRAFLSGSAGQGDA